MLNPATEEALRTVPYGTGADCPAAIDAAQHAFAGVARTDRVRARGDSQRAADAMRAQADELGRTTVRESGKPLVQARGEWMVSADLFEWFAEEGKRA